MSKTRKVLALALALVMSCTMAACGGDSETTDGGSTSTSADGTYKIGMIYPMAETPFLEMPWCPQLRLPLI